MVNGASILLEYISVQNDHISESYHFTRRVLLLTMVGNRKQLEEQTELGLRKG